MATAADVPDKFDVVINGQGYILDRSYDDSPYRQPPAEYTSTATFLERTNVGASYGDDQQDFFLTETQNDWTGGEGRAFFRVGDQAAISMYERSKYVEVKSPGGLRLALDTVTSAGTNTILAGCAIGTTHYLVDATNLYSVDFGGARNSLGAHGAGTPSKWGVATDGVNIYISGATKLRKYNVAAPAFSDFGTNAAVGAIAFNGNLLYSCDGSVLNSYSGAGVASLIYTWKDATGTPLVVGAQTPKILPFGGWVMILWPYMVSGPELWKYDGTNTNIAAHLPAGSVAYDMVELGGNLYCSGALWDTNTQIYLVPGGYIGQVPTLWVYASGAIDIAWKEQSIYGTGQLVPNNPALSPLGTFRGSVVFQGLNDGVDALKLYEPATGTVVTLANLTGVVATTGTRQITTARSTVCWSTSSASIDAVMYPASTLPASGTLCLARFDFDNSLQKNFRSVKIDWENYPADSGSSVSFTLQVDENSGLQGSGGGVASGAETLLSSTLVGRTCQVWLTLTKGSSTYGPIIRRVYVRASPVLQAYKQRRYLLDLVGNKRANPEQYLTLCNGQPHTKDGEEMRADLVTAIAAGPISITDRFGTFTGVIEAPETIFKETRADYGRAEYRALVVVREI